MNLFRDRIRSYDREYSNFYDYLAYGSGASLERVLQKSPDWRGLVAVGLGYDLGLTGLPVDYRKADASYEKAAKAVDERNRGDRIPFGDFEYFYHLATQSLLDERSVKEQKVRQVCLALIGTCRMINADESMVMVRPERMANILNAVKAQWKVGALVDEVLDPSLELLSMYTSFSFDRFKALIDDARSGRSDYLSFVMGVLFWDVKRNPYGADSVRKEFGVEYRESAVDMLMTAAEHGSIAAFQYLGEIADESSIGRAYVSSTLGIHADNVRGELFDIGLKICENNSEYQEEAARLLKEAMYGSI